MKSIGLASEWLHSWHPREFSFSLLGTQNDGNQTILLNIRSFALSYAIYNKNHRCLDAFVIVHIKCNDRLIGKALKHR